LPWLSDGFHGAKLRIHPRRQLCCQLLGQGLELQRFVRGVATQHGLCKPAKIREVTIHYYPLLSNRFTIHYYPKWVTIHYYPTGLILLDMISSGWILYLISFKGVSENMLSYHHMIIGNRENDDHPMDSEVRYFQTNPCNHCKTHTLWGNV
jgi:hypothetical protein